MNPWQIVYGFMWALLLFGICVAIGLFASGCTLELRPYTPRTSAPVKHKHHTDAHKHKSRQTKAEILEPIAPLLLDTYETPTPAPYLPDGNRNLY